MVEKEKIQIRPHQSKSRQIIAIEQNRSRILYEGKYQNEKRTRQVVSYFSSVLDRKELTQPSEHRSTKLLYMLCYLILFVVRDFNDMAL